MKRGIGENRVELASKGEMRALGNSRVNAPFARSADHVRRRIDSHDDCAGGGELFGQYAIPAGKIEDPLAHAWLEQVQNWLSQRWNKMSVARVTISVPFLSGILWHRTLT
jgi:hypothetical protein